MDENFLLTRFDALELLDEGCPAMIVNIDSGVVYYATRQIESMFGFAHNEMTGMNVDDLVPDSVRERHPGHREAYKKAPGSRPMGMGLAVRGRRKNGDEFPAAVALKDLVPASSRKKVVVVTVLDQTMQKG